MVFLAATVLFGCAWLALRILRGQQGPREPRERDPEVEEALERLREQLRRPRAVIAAGVVVALLLVAVLVRNPGRWAVLLLALGVLLVAVVGYVVAARRNPR
jgi:hypothetical protein